MNYTAPRLSRYEISFQAFASKLAQVAFELVDQVKIKPMEHLVAPVFREGASLSVPFPAAENC
jgi:hypothetical protein